MKTSSREIHEVEELQDYVHFHSQDNEFLWTDNEIKQKIN